MKRKKKQSAIEQTLGELAQLLPGAATAFTELVQASPTQRPAKAAAIATIEGEADDRHLDLVREVGSTFITPYDREDLFGLLESLDDILDGFDLAARTIAAVPIDAIPAPLMRNAQELQAMALLMSQAVHQVKDPEELVATLVKVNEHFGALQSNHVSFLAVALTDSASPIESLRGKVIADQMQSIGDSMEIFGRALGVMAIKET